MKMKSPIISLCILTSTLSINCLADVSVIVNPSNNSELSKSAISKIYLGKTKTFPNGDKVLALNLKSSNNVRNNFQQEILGKSTAQVKAYWSKLIFTGKGKPLKELATEEDILAMVASTPNAIGYIDSSKVNDTVKVVK